CLPSASTASIRHEQIMVPSTITVQAPQSPVPHPSLVPVNIISSRRTSRSVCWGSHRYSYSSPFTVVATWYFLLMCSASPVPTPIGRHGSPTPPPLLRDILRGHACHRSA